MLVEIEADAIVAQEAQLYAIGALNEGKSYAARIELLRLLLVVPVSGAVLQEMAVIDVPDSALWATVGLYIAVSLIGLRYSLNLNKTYT